MNKLFVIAGVTASGKTARALALAEELTSAGAQPEILNCDTLQFYRELEIGNNKGQLLVGKTSATLSEWSQPLQAAHYPSAPEVPVWFVDWLLASDSCNAALYQTLARQLLDQIWERGGTPILVGGSGFYVAAVIRDYHFAELEVAPAVDDISKLDIDASAARLLARGYDLSQLNRSDRRNPRRLHNILRKLNAGVDATAQQPEQLPALFYPAGTVSLEVVEIDEATLQQKLQKRASEMLSAGLLPEVETLREKYVYAKISASIRLASGYREVFEWLDAGQTSSKDELITAIWRSHFKLAKKQTRWNQKYLKGADFLAPQA